MDAWAKPLTQKWPNYNLYKLIILYWAQNPYSKGAAVLCQHVLQKPIYDDDEKEESDKRQQHDYYDYNNDYQSSSPPVYTIPGGATVDDCASSSSSSATSSSSFDHPPSPEEMTLTIETPHHHHQSILDGYTPTLQESDRASSHKVKKMGSVREKDTHTSENLSCSMLHCITHSADFIFCAGFLHRR